MSCDDLNGRGHGLERLLFLLVTAALAVVIIVAVLRMARSH